ncbi:MAG: hypothetical protein HUU14_00415 [Dehalococcoidia bacterium]|nr:hypothetical protein [Chloroflexi bacterium CFX7]MCK6564630.1 hypothetical protein [Dehalococcoidia bacterium]NUQ54331.1 hypothetical protein [Dehalococcoidia bacterium]RIL01727.1 MAG: hypothetical protein DCC78_09845 [bacterium]
MESAVRYPANASIYEALRNRPGALVRLQEAGLSREHLEFRIGDAARMLGVPAERLAEVLLRERSGRAEEQVAEARP